MKPWTAAILLFAVLLACDAFVVVHGIDGYFWKFKTPAELQVQQRLAR